MIRCGDVIPLACIAAVSLPFPGGEIEQASRRVCERRRAPGVGKKSGRSREGGEREGGGGGKKGNRLQSIPKILPNSREQ